MQKIFLNILDMSIVASIVIIAVLIVRIFLKKAPKLYSYALWAVVLFRLLCPFSIESAISLIPEQVQDIPQETALETTEHVTPISAVDAAQRAVGDVLNGGIEPIWVRLDSETVGNQGVSQASHPQVWLLFLGVLWPVGMAGMLVYSIVSYVKLRRRLIGAVLLGDSGESELMSGQNPYNEQEKAHPLSIYRLIWKRREKQPNIYIADYIESPFVTGLIRPRIYLPSTLAESEREYILLHEQHHIRRGDHIVKFLSFLALCIHWFNPLVWLAFAQAGKDMEMSCDEAVVKKLGEQIRADYSASLLKLATGKRILAGMPLAFGEGDTKGRIRNLGKWKKPKVWISVLAIVICIIVAVVCFVNPKSEPNPAEVVGEYDISRLGGAFLKSGNPAYSVGMNAYGMPVFKNCDLAFSVMLEEYEAAIDFIREQYDLPPISKREYDGYKKYGAQVVVEDEELRSQCMAVAQFLDLYENSFEKSGILNGGVSTQQTLAELPEGAILLFKESEYKVYTGGAFLFQLGNQSPQPADGSEYEKIVLEGDKLTVVSSDGVILYQGNCGGEETWLRGAFLETYETLGLYNPDTGKLIKKELDKLVPEFDDNMEIKYFYISEAEKKAAYMIYYFNGKPAWLVNGKTMQFFEMVPARAEVVPGASYISYSCRYMNLLSSAFSNGDTGYRYLVGEDSFTFLNRSTGNQRVINSVEWGWQAFPWTDEQWTELYFPSSLSEYKISQYYDEMLYQPLSEGYCLLSMDGELWLVELHKTPQKAPYIWSIFKLMPETVPDFS